MEKTKGEKKKKQSHDMQSCAKQFSQASDVRPSAAQPCAETMDLLELFREQHRSRTIVEKQPPKSDKSIPIKAFDETLISPTQRFL